MSDILTFALKKLKIKVQFLIGKSACIACAILIEFIPSVVLHLMQCSRFFFTGRSVALGKCSLKPAPLCTGRLHF